MYDVATHLLISRAHHQELTEQAARVRRASRVSRLRRLDRQVERATARARLVRLALA